MNISAMVAALVGLIGYASPTPAPTASTVAPLKGDYVEARTESVFAGPCHVNGEVMSGGRDAIMAWQFDNGARVMAVVSSGANLADAGAVHQSEIVIDPSAGSAKAQAALHAILAHDQALLGKIVSVRGGKISFSHVDREYKVECAGFGVMDVQGMPDDECCKQPNLVWFEPLVKLNGRKVGYTVNAEYAGGSVADSWQRGDENGAYCGACAY
jgi:hypothetical protein